MAMAMAMAPELCPRHRGGAWSSRSRTSPAGAGEIGKPHPPAPAPGRARGKQRHRVLPTDQRSLPGRGQRRQGCAFKGPGEAVEGGLLRAGAAPSRRPSFPPPLPPSLPRQPGGRWAVPVAAAASRLPQPWLSPCAAGSRCCRCSCWKPGGCERRNRAAAAAAPWRSSPPRRRRRRATGRTA